jgi:predicted cation transporter
MLTNPLLISGVLSKEFFVHIFDNKFMYMISGTVFAAGILFKFFNSKLSNIVQYLLSRISLKLFIFLMIVLLGLVSSVITAIIASLILVEIINVLPLNRKNRISINIIACFSIGLGASLTPVGEPLATVVISKLNVGFWYLLQQFGVLIVSGIVLLGILGIFYTSKNENYAVENNSELVEEETFKVVLIRTFKVFMFIIALELLGGGYKPLIDAYVIKLNSHLLYWANMISAILDNATLATAEISTSMSYVQIKSVLLGLLISGGMMIPGNIPNIISADKLKIKSGEWIKLGVPVGKG